MNPGHTLPSHFFKTTFKTSTLLCFSLPSSLLTIVFSTKNLHTFAFCPILKHKKWFQKRLIICACSNLLTNEDSKCYCETNKSHAETCMCSAAINYVTTGKKRRRFYSLWCRRNIAKLQAVLVPTLCSINYTWRHILFWRLRQRNLHQAGIIPPY